MTELEKIDELRRRLGLSYKEAKEALDRAGGDIISALIQNEETKKQDVQDKFEEWSNKMVEQIRGIMQQGKVTRIKIKKEGSTVAEVPASVGALGIAGILISKELAILAGIGTVAALLSRYTLEVERPDGKVEEHSLDFYGQVDK